MSGWGVTDDDAVDPGFHAAEKGLPDFHPFSSLRGNGLPPELVISRGLVDYIASIEEAGGVPIDRLILTFARMAGAIIQIEKELRRRRDFARQRWPCGQHKIAVWRLAPTAAPRIPRVNLPMAAPFGLGSRRGICVYHRRCGTTSSARRERPLVHIRTRICAGDPVPLKPATLLPSSATICRSGILKRLAARRASRWPAALHRL